MKRFLLSMVRIFISWNIGLITIVIAYFLLDIKLLESFIIGACLYYLTSFLFRRKFGKRIGKDIELEKLIYRKKEMQGARLKVYKIGKSRFKMRSVNMWQTITKIHKILLKMITIVEKEPNRFQSVQSFFITYLDSLLMIVDKYTFLVSQPVKNQEIRLAIKKTEETLAEMASALENEMLGILENDVLDLDIELNVLKKSLEESTTTISHLDYSKFKGE